MDLYKTPYFHIKLCLLTFHCAQKIEILKHVPEGDETEQGLQRGWFLGILFVFMTTFSKISFLIQPGLLYLELRFSPLLLIGLSAFFHPSNASHSVYNRWYKRINQILI